MAGMKSQLDWLMAVFWAGQTPCKTLNLQCRRVLGAEAQINPLNPFHAGKETVSAC